MSFGNKRLDASYDKWVTQTPEDYFGNEEEEEEEEVVRELLQEVKDRNEVR